METDIYGSTQEMSLAELSHVPLQNLTLFFAIWRQSVIQLSANNSGKHPECTLKNITLTTLSPKGWREHMDPVWTEPNTLTMNIWLQERCGVLGAQLPLKYWAMFCVKNAITSINQISKAQPRWTSARKYARCADATGNKFVMLPVRNMTVAVSCYR